MSNPPHWQSHPSQIMQAPLPLPPLPPPLAHKVWILNCKSCNTFLTNRGMKMVDDYVMSCYPLWDNNRLDFLTLFLIKNSSDNVVLLLQPNVPLYSTDVMPINCSTHSSSSQASLSAAVALGT
ncbi:hypothetical protein C8Q75DRAFT_732954 [Abortiporus biennis]|nr:hypothetical protein C8Q75DRAFT_732954 [Abortiporus biennis]